MGENKFLSIVEWTNKMWHSHMMANKKKRWISKSLCWAKGTNIKESVMYDSIYIQSFKCTLIYYDKKQISGCLGQPNSCPTGTAERNKPTAKEQKETLGSDGTVLFLIVLVVLWMWAAAKALGLYALNGWFNCAEITPQWN